MCQQGCGCTLQAALGRETELQTQLQTSEARTAAAVAARAAAEVDAEARVAAADARAAGAGKRWHGLQRAARWAVRLRLWVARWRRRQRATGRRRR